MVLTFLEVLMVFIMSSFKF